MTSLVARHPAVDLATPTAAVVVQDREVVGLDPWLLDAALTCRAETVQLQLVTPARSRLTTPLVTFLSESSARWIVRAEGLDASEGTPSSNLSNMATPLPTHWYDGITGHVLDWDGKAFVPLGDKIAPEFLNGYSPTTGSLVVDVTVGHAASTTLLLGGIVEQCYESLALGPPAGWGVAEPVTQAWDRGELTALCRNRTPRPTALVVIGGQQEGLALGTLEVSRTTSGVVERLRLGVGSSTVEAARFDALAERLANSLPPPRTMLTGLQPGRSDGTVEPRLTPPAVPYGLFVGPEVVAGVGCDRVAATLGGHVELIGPADAACCWVRVSGGPSDDPVTGLASALAHLRQLSELSGNQAG